MRLVQASYSILYPAEVDWPAMLGRIEAAGRTCYKSEDRITGDSAAKFVQMVIGRGHHAMLEHGGSISVRFVYDRGISHEKVRMRLCSFAQESTRYCNYGKGRFGGEIAVVDARAHIQNDIRQWFSREADAHPEDEREPEGLEVDLAEALSLWLEHMRTCERRYLRLLELHVKPQIARSVLPTALKTEIVVTANPREWRHIFELRTAADAHPQMIEVMRPLLSEFRRRVPVLFDDVGVTS